MHIQEMSEKFPEAFEQFKDVCATLEEHYRDMQDMEFTVENRKLYKFFKCFWEFLFHLSDRHWCSNTYNYVFTLSIL